MAGTVTTTRITDKPFYFTRRNIASGGLLVGDVFDVSKSYSNSWGPAVQQTTSFRSGKAFLKALDDPEQHVVQDEDLSDRALPDRSDQLMLRERNQAIKDSTYDHGHPFSTIRIERDLSTIVDLRNQAGTCSYYGPMTVVGGTGVTGSGLDGRLDQFGYPRILPSGEIPDINLALGTKAINKTIPTLPVAGMAAFLGELHEGLPKMIGHSSLFRERAHAFHGLGSEYLNVQFGWKPFLSDVRKFAKAFKNAGEILKQYRRDSGKTVHRHYTFPVIRDTKVYSPTPIGMGVGQNPADFAFRIPCDNTVYGTFTSGELQSLLRSGTSASIHASSVRKQRYWFSGAYSYLVSEDDSFLGRMEGYIQQANKLLGVKVTPDVLWELTPWSWLLDWEVNIGVNISNLTAFGQDNLALRWGYLMRETSYNHYTSTSNISSYGNWGGPIHSTWRIVKKERIRSTPFGFGLNADGFTDHQWSILGALGLTRAPKKLF